MQRVRYILVLLIVTSWPTMAMPRLIPLAPNPLLGDDHTRIIRTRLDAVIDLPWDVLAASGWDLAAIAPANIQVWRQGVQIPAQVTAVGVSFLADANTSPFSMEAAYWIGIGDQPGLRTFLPPEPTMPLTWEPDVIYQSVVATARGDRWFAGELRTMGTPIMATLPLPTALPIGSHIDLALTPVDLRSGHQIGVTANGSSLGNVTWDDSSSGPRHVTLTTRAALAAGSVTLALALTSNGADVVLLDSLTLPEVAVSRPHMTPALEAPRPTPARTGADQLIIAHPDLIPALDPLIAAKQQRGRSVAVADVLAIYDAYSWGERDPDAIRAYLRAVVAGPHPPTSILLVGATTTRLRVGPGDTDTALIPPYLLVSDAVYGEIACDTCYTRLAAADVRDQPRPDLPIGRLSARTLAEAQTMIAKTIAALSPPSGAWRSRMLLVADNDRDAAGSPDPAGPFSPLLSAMVTGLPTMQAQMFVYAPDQPRDDGPYQHAAALRIRLFAAWDAGAGLIAYVGHASPWQWAWTGTTEPVPYLVTRGDAVRTNGTRLPILLSMTCLSGSFANPTLTALDAELLHQSGGGIVAALSPSGSGVNTGHTLMMTAILPALHDGQSLGTAHLAGLQALLAQPDDHALVFSYSILGDPDVTLPPSNPMYSIALPEVVHP